MGAREQIMEAADRLFGEVGFDAATTREIALQSGVNKALIHYHFKSKEALLEALLDRYYENLNRTLLRALEQNGTPRERMVRLIDAYIDFLRANRNFSRIVQRESSGGKRLAQISGHLVPLFERGARLVEEAFPSTRSGELGSRQLFVTFYGMIVSYFTYSGVIERLMGADPFSRKAFEQRKKHVHRVLDLVLDEIDGAVRTGKRVRP